MKSTSRVGAADTFSRVTRELQHIESELERTKAQRGEKLKELRAFLLERLALHRALFEPLMSDYRVDFEPVDDHHRLENWDIEDDELVAGFAYTFRGEYNGYQVRLPLRYLAQDGIEAMQADAGKLRQEHEAQEREQRLAREQSERQRLQELMAKYPDIAAGAQGEQQ